MGDDVQESRLGDRQRHRLLQRVGLRIDDLTVVVTSRRVDRGNDSRPSAPRFGRSTRLAALAALVAALTFARTIGHGFVFDDHWTIVQNRFLSGPLGPLLGATLHGDAHAAGIPDAT